MTSFLAPYGSTIVDVVNRYYGSLDATYKFIQGNPSLDSLMSSLAVVPPLELVYDETYYIAPSEVQNAAPAPPPAIQTIIAQRGQSLIDLVLQAYTTLDQTYKLLQDNGIPALTATDFFGVPFQYTTALIVDEVIADQNAAQGTIYATLPPINPLTQGHSFDSSFNKSFDAPTG